MNPAHAVALIVLTTTAAHAQTFTVLSPSSLEGTPHSLHDVSADGSTVVGNLQVPGGPPFVFHSLRWRLGIGIDQPAPQGPRMDAVSSLSEDTAILLGYRGRTNTTDFDAWLKVGDDEAYFVTLPKGYTTAHSPVLSRDGRVALLNIITPGDPDHPGRAAAYEIATGEFTIVDPLPGATHCGASAISADGSVIVGGCTVADVQRSFIWTSESGTVDLGLPPGAIWCSAATLSADGSSVFAQAGDYENFRVLRWTQQTGFTDIGPGGSLDGASPDGRAFFGAFSVDNEERLVWDDVNGFRSMTAILEGAGLAEQLAGWDIYRVLAMNHGPNGYVFAGSANNSTTFEYTWWVATLPSLGGDCAAILTQPPGHTTAVPRDTVTLSAEVGGAEPLTFQWFKDKEPLADDDHFSGTDTPTLTITEAQKTDSGTYHLRAMNDCSPVNTRPSTLDVVTPPPPCIADFIPDGIVNTQDFFDFLNAFFNQSPAADINNDDLINSQDVFDFLASFFTGCDD